MRRFSLLPTGPALLLAPGILACLCSPASSATATLRIDPNEIEGAIPVTVYAHFLEHIYHSVDDGLCGELMQNRSFVPPQRDFSIEGGVLRQESLATDVRMFAGDAAWQDYEFTLRARKVSGAEGFLIIVRAEDDDNFYWWNIGGWGNVRHGLEVERDGARAGLPGVDGRVDTGRWYDIRVRVEGDHIQGFIDGERLLDVRDATHVRGRIGLGTWATQAEFADIKVTALDGTPLECDFMPASEAPSPEFWEAVPEGASVDMVKTGSPNTGWSARIDLSGQPGLCGIAQQRINAVRAHSYHGRLWAYHVGKLDRAVARLVSSDGEVMSEDALSIATYPWGECTFKLNATRHDPSARLEILAEGDDTLWIDMVSLYRDDSVETGCRRDLLEAVAGLQPPVIRWPGGCFASIYHWKDSIGPQQERKPFYNRPWDDWDPASFGTDEFMRMCDEVGAEPLVVLNLGSWDEPAKWEGYLAEAIEWVEYLNGDTNTPMGKLRAENGHPEPYNVKHIELDNETWAMGVEGYAERLIPFAKAIRQRWPDVTLYACTFWRDGDPKLLELAGEYIDVISYHLYDDPNNYGAGPLNFERTWESYEEFVPQSSNPDVTLAITEWNAQSTDFRTGLFAAGLLNVMERVDRVTMGNPALFLRRVDAPAWDNAFINHDHTRWFPAPNYVVMKLYREHYQPHRVALETEGDLNVVATVNDDGDRLVIKAVNASAEDVLGVISLADGAEADGGYAWVVAADLLDRNTLDEPNRIAPVQSRVDHKGAEFEHVFPANSVTVLELELE